MSEETTAWPICEACGSRKRPNPQNSGDVHVCGPLDLAKHQGRILQRLLAAIEAMDTNF